MKMKICPLLSIADPRDRNCLYADCMLFCKATEQCSISVIAVELQSTSADTCSINDSLENISKELPNVTTAVKGLV